MKVMTILGTRPELIKLSEIIKALDRETEHIFVHTNQNFDYNLDGIFYKDLGLREPNINLYMDGIGDMMFKIEQVLNNNMPDAVVILGDTNSSLCGYVAKRLKIPVFHLEAGNRCFDDNVPEEINRRMIDHIADINLVYTEHARQNLLSEGLKADRIFKMGSPMLEVIKKQVDKLFGMHAPQGDYYLFSIHREENVDSDNLVHIVNAINFLANGTRVVLSCHPRLRNKKIKFHKNVEVHEPFGYTDYLKLQSNAKCVISDSGTVAEESNILGFKAITVRDAMERPEAIDAGSIIKVNPKDIVNYIHLAKVPKEAIDGYDVSDCSDRVLRIILGYKDYINKYVWRKND